MSDIQDNTPPVQLVPPVAQVFDSTSPTAPPIEFREAPTAAPITQPLTERLASSGTPHSLKRSYFEDDIIADDVYTTVVTMGDAKFYAKEFTKDELKAFRGIAKSVAAEMGVAENLAHDIEAFSAALAAIPPDADGNSGMEQYAIRMADTFNGVLLKHLRGWDFPFPCTDQKKLNLWSSNKFEFCMNLAQLGGLSGREANELKNS